MDKLKSRIDSESKFQPITTSPIVVYRAKSGGEILGEHDSMHELARIETGKRGIVIPRKRGYDMNIYYALYNALNRTNKRLKSYYYGCDIAIRLKRNQ
jgi:hypothetical protein